MKSISGSFNTVNGKYCCNLRGAGDTTWMFSKSILADDEVVVSNKKLLKHKVAYVVRFPHSARSEFAIVRLVSKEEYIDRVKKSDLKPAFKFQYRKR